MSMRQRKWELLLILAPLIVFVLTYGVLAWRDRNEINVDIGSYPNQHLEQQAAIFRLSLELKKHPDANIFKVRAGNKTPWRESIVKYIRVSSNKKLSPNKQLLYMDDRFYSPAFDSKTGIRATGLVPEELIHAVARKGGDFLDMSNAQNRQWQLKSRSMTTTYTDELK